MKDKKIAVLSPVAWRTPPREYGAWETVASNITEGLVKRGWDVTLFATKDSITSGRLRSIVSSGYEEDRSQHPKVVECLHISEVFENAKDFDLIHNNFDFLPLTYSKLVSTPMLTTIHGFSSPQIMPVYNKYKDNYFVSISDSDRASGLNYLATVYNGIDLNDFTFDDKGGDNLVFLGRIHEEKGAHLAIDVAKQSGRKLIIAGIVQDEDYFNNKLKPHIDGKNVEFIGPVGPQARNEVLSNAFAVLHLNTIPERFGLVMAESMAVGTPVVAMDLGSCREVIEDGKTGFLVNNVNEAVLTINNVQNISRLDCRKRVEDNFTLDIMVEKYEQVYQKIWEKN